MLKLGKYGIGFLAAAVVSLFSGIVQGGTPHAPNPMEQYGDTLEFSVIRNGDVVGNHVVTFKKVAGNLKVESLFNLKLSLLGIPIYNYSYDSVEYWSGGRLASLKVVIDDDGSKHYNIATREEQGFWVNGTEVDDTRDTDIFPTNHWNVGVLEQSRVLNTITGEINQVDIQNEGQEVIAVSGGHLMATRYSYSGDLRTTAWYDNQGRWVKLKFKARDNSDIEYLCLTCGTLIGEMDAQ